MTDQEYKTMIQSIVIPDDLPVEEKQKRYLPLVEYTLANTPDQVYRFRKCTDRSMSELDQCIISFTHGDKMNDDFDGMLYFDRDKILANIRSVFEKVRFETLVQYIQQANFPPLMQNKLPVSMLTALQQSAQQISAEQIDSFSQRLYEFFVKQLDISSTGLRSIIQKNIPFACFSANISSPTMWGYYADSGKGFALGYDFRNQNYTSCDTCAVREQCPSDTRCTLVPVIYDDERVDATELAEWAFQTKLYYDLGLAELFSEAAKNIACPDSFMQTKVLLHKSTDWKHEQEWRLIFSNRSPANMQQGHPCKKKKPATLYLGRNISKINEKLLRHIAAEKEIPVYKMEIDHHQRDYRLNPVPIST